MADQAGLHLRPRDGEPQETTTVELFFDLVYVLAITQLSHVLIGDLSWAGAGHMTFLAIVVWWAWINTTWMVNWFDPRSRRVRLVVIATMLASLLMAAALPNAFGDDALLFALAYVGLQLGRNAGCVLLLDRAQALRDIFERLALWTLVSAPLWLAGAFVDGDTRLVLWAPALALDLVAPLVGYRWPGRARVNEYGSSIDGSHFAERCQLFVIIALGESIVVTGATATDRGLSPSVTAALVVAFLTTATLWWLYFGEVAIHSRREMSEREDVTALARDAYTYLHFPVVIGIVVSAVGAEVLLAHPRDPLETAATLVVLGGPILFLGGELLFRERMIGTLNPKRLAAIVVIAALFPLGSVLPALALAALVAAVLLALAWWEYERVPSAAEHPSVIA